MVKKEYQVGLRTQDGIPAVVLRAIQKEKQRLQEEIAELDRHLWGKEKASPNPIEAPPAKTGWEYLKEDSALTKLLKAEKAKEDVPRDWEEAGGGG